MTSLARVFISGQSSLYEKRCAVFFLCQICIKERRKGKLKQKQKVEKDKKHVTDFSKVVMHFSVKGGGKIENPKQ